MFLDSTFVSWRLCSLILLAASKGRIPFRAEKRVEPLTACMSGFKAVADTVVQRVTAYVRVDEARFQHEMTKAWRRRLRQETVAAEEASPPQSQGEGQLTQTLARYTYTARMKR